MHDTVVWTQERDWIPGIAMQRAERGLGILHVTLSPFILSVVVIWLPAIKEAQKAEDSSQVQWLCCVYSISLMVTNVIWPDLTRPWRPSRFVSSYFSLSKSTIPNTWLSENMLTNLTLNLVCVRIRKRHIYAFVQWWCFLISFSRELLSACYT